MRETIGWGGHRPYDRFIAGRFLRFYETQMARFEATGHVLDVGCGPGRLAHAIAAAHPQAAVVGADLDPVQTRMAGQGPSDAGFVTAAVEALPLRDRTFDAAVTTESYHHWADPDAGLRDLARVLRPGGRMLVWELAGDIRHDELTSWAGRVPRVVMPFVRAVARRHGFTSDALHERLMPAMAVHFDDVQVERQGGWWLVTGRAR